MENGIRIGLPQEEFCQTWEDCSKWKNLSEEVFMQQYGNEVLKEYHLPTEAEIKQSQQWDEEEVLEEAEVVEEAEEGEGEEGEIIEHLGQ
jgi:hypothetical protein